MLQRQLSRAALGRGICEREDWRNPKGELCTASARKALPALAAQLGLPLPAAQPGPPASAACFTGSLEQLGAVRVRPAHSEAERRLCADLLAQHHPLGPGRAPGCRLSYLLEAACGPLGVLSFVAAPFRLGPRDAFLGWDERTRGAHIERVVSNDRLVLVEGVRVANLASHVLGQALARLARDWQREHAVQPWLVETCVHSARPGTSYKAAGWQCVGQTQGQPPGSGAAVEPKAVWLRGLQPDWQSRLCQPPERRLGQYPALVLADEANWARREFLRTDLPDGRLRQRLERLGQSWERHPGEELPAIFPHPAELKAAERFLHNDKVQDRDILQPHREALLERVDGDNYFGRRPSLNSIFQDGFIREPSQIAPNLLRYLYRVVIRKSTHDPSSSRRNRRGPALRLPLQYVQRMDIPRPLSLLRPWCHGNEMCIGAGRVDVTVLGCDQAAVLMGFDIGIHLSERLPGGLLFALGGVHPSGCPREEFGVHGIGCPVLVTRTAVRSATGDPRPLPPEAFLPTPNRASRRTSRGKLQCLEVVHTGHHLKVWEFRRRSAPQLLPRKEESAVP